MSAVRRLLLIAGLPFRVVRFVMRAVAFFGQFVFGVLMLALIVGVVVLAQGNVH